VSATTGIEAVDCAGPSRQDSRPDHVNRHDFGVSWNSPLEKGGVVVGDDVAITIDAEAILEPEG
jgi:hypothetical protein